jgi:hypothetical protein
MRGINIANEKGRNAQVLYENPAPKRGVIYVTAEKERPQSVRLIKSMKSVNGLMAEFGVDLSYMLIKEDPEIDIETTGRFVGKASKILLDHAGKLVYKVRVEEEVYGPEGDLKETREPKTLASNIMKDEEPLKSSKLFPKSEIFNRFIFARKYQIRHTNGLSFDFLYDIAKELHDKDSLALLGSGAKGVGPLVFQEGGKPYRAFLEGRIQEESYCLILHISNLELKGIIQK